MKKLSVVLFIFSHPRLHPLCLSDGPTLLTSLSDCSTHIFKRTRTGISGPRPIRGGVRPSLSLIGLDHDMGLMCVCLLLNHREIFRVAETFFFLRTAGRTGATSDFFLSHHWEIRSHVCDQIGRTLEPCIQEQRNLSTLPHYFLLITV